MASVNGEFALASVTHERATDLHTLSAGDAGGKHKRRSAPGESCMNRFSDAGSTPAVSIPNERKHRQTVLFLVYSLFFMCTKC